MAGDSTAAVPTLPGYIWRTAEAPEAVARALAAALDLPLPLAALLASRGHDSADTAAAFLEPLKQKLADPMDVAELREAAQRVQQTITADTDTRVAALTHLVEENESNVRRFQNDVSQLVSTRLNDAEDRINTRVMAAEARMKEDAGTRIAEVQAHVGRVDGHIDETLQIVNNRLAGFDERVVANDRRLEGVEQRLEGVDRAALDELANKMSSAVGEAMLVRIEMERAEKSLNERTDTLAVRVTEVEAQIQDVTMDVSTAVQLDRLEEVERMVAELDPNKFVLREGVQPISGLPDPNAPRHTASVDEDSYPTAPASIFGIVDPDDRPNMSTSPDLLEADESDKADERVDHGAA